MSTLDIADAVALRGLIDTYQQATAAWWERRAEAFDWAAPRPGDFTGRATPEQVARRADHCREAARLCRAHAELLREVVV
ncbi:hypothetical protein [Enemella evansiae]|uniref:hypothetical protein n=1 Tax=Enemella evansiae TaxID=2016499 RepID=UPI00117EC6FD|nr:hypothetical protein [Enemella evansiae]